MNVDILLGKTTEHLVPLEGTKFLIHKQMLKDFLKLQRDASEAGHSLQIASAFRDFERQLKIWNLKASGQRQLFDDLEKPLDFAALTPNEIVTAIMRWSALPGTSRHHWGTDFDVYDGNTQKEDEVKLVPSETIENGPASSLHAWLDSRIHANESYGFFRPYGTDRGGVAPERWHLSYHPLSRRYLEAYTFSIYKKNIEDTDLLLKDILMDNLDALYNRYFLNIDHLHD